MYEIIANPEDYAIGALEEGFGHGQIPFPDDKRKRWAEEIGADGYGNNAEEAVQAVTQLKAKCYSWEFTEDE